MIMVDRICEKVDTFLEKMDKILPLAYHIQG